MGLHIGKYAFNSEKQAKNKIKALGEYIDEEGNRTPYAFAFCCGAGVRSAIRKHLQRSWELLHPAVYGTDYLVDVLWYDLEENEDGSISHPYGWATYSVDVSGEGINSFLGLKYQELKITNN